MAQRKTRWREPAKAAQTEQLLTSSYGQLSKWAMVLTRGDVTRAQDIVQEFCLYLTLTKPNLSEVANLDGYLYTSLRHIYLSGLARSSREAERFVNIAEFDSFEFAMERNRPGDPLQRQNDLRRICNYAVWRKESSKSASYFIFHFFHGYSRREIAEVACLPISAIYNKLKAARDETSNFISEPHRLRLVIRESPPEATLSWILVSSIELFKELRESILLGRASDCFVEEELLSHYRVPSVPIPCSLLAHIVSCDRCLEIIDRHFRRPTLLDREPLDCFDSSSRDTNLEIAGSNGMDEMAMMRSVRQRWGTTFEHRPNTLSIAVNGKIVAFHDVLSAHSTLFARIEHPETAEFVEVFSEQDVRLALLSVGDLPPKGPNVRTLRVNLSDSRWLELSLTFDGLGLNSAVAYSDPALAVDAIEERVEDAIAAPVPTLNRHAPPSEIHPSPNQSWIKRLLDRLTGALVPSSALAWAMAILLMLGATGYLAYHHAIGTTPAGTLLAQSIKVETTALRGQTEHQVVKIQEISADGRILQRGSVDLWRDGDNRRYVRRLYDSKNQLIGTRWRSKDGEHITEGKGRARAGRDTPDSLSENALWDQDLSASAFSRLKGNESEVRTVDSGYELTAVSPFEGHPQLILATLILDSKLLPVRQVMRFRHESEVRELRFSQAVFERKPSSSIPDEIFDPEYEQLHPAQDHSSSGIRESHLGNNPDENVELAQLQIAVLYELNGFGADTRQPIEVARTSDGRIRVSGTIADDTLKRGILSHLKALKCHELLDLRILSPHDVKTKASAAAPQLAQDAKVYEVEQTQPFAQAAVRKYIQRNGVSGTGLDSGASQFSHDALQHGQLALQHAYALSRLSNALSDSELQAVNFNSQERWTEMVNKHAIDLEHELRELQMQLDEIAKPEEQAPPLNAHYMQIENPTEFRLATEAILSQTQDLNHKVGNLFTSNQSEEDQAFHDAPLMSTLKVVPVKQVEEILRFASRLDVSVKSFPHQNDRNAESGSRQPQ
jgi:DNA-directed RNA polymerase specialized sigma24 family protein